MKADVVKEAYDNKGNDVTGFHPQSPYIKSTFITNMEILEPNDKMTSPISKVGRVGFLPDEVHEIKMVTLQSRKMRQMSVFLVFFVIISLVMTGLFIWRTAFFDHLHTNDKCKDKTCSTSESKTPPTPHNLPCRHRAKPRPFRKLPEKIVDELKFMQESIANKTLFSLANVVYMDKVIWSHFHGHPKYNHGKKLDEHTLFPVASVAKILTALMAFKMYDNRKVDTLDDEFVKYEPNFEIKRRFKSKRPIVIRDILSHMSGLPREAPCYPDTDVNICPYNNTEMLRRISEMYLVMKPGRKPSYSNLGFGLLGQSLPMSLYNLTYEKWIEEHLFKPLGLNDSTFDLSQSNQNKIITGKGPAGEYVKPATWGWLNPTGGLFTSTSDLAKLWISLFKSLDEEDYLSPVIANELFAPAYVFPSERTLVGVPFEMYLDNGYLIRKKNGEVHGYTSNVYLVPELKLAFSFMTPQISGHFPGGPLFSKLLKAFHEVLGSNATKISLPGHPQAFLGKYEPVNENTTAPGISQIEVKQNNDRMILQIVYYGTPLDFPMNYLRNGTFEIWDRNDNCLSVFIRGFDLERVYFGTISNETNYLAPGLHIYGVDARGWTYFKRVK